MKPLCIDLFCGYGGWARGFLDAGYRVIGYDIEPKCGDFYPGDFVLQDVTSLSGDRFKEARIIVASPPCMRFSLAQNAWGTRDVSAGMPLVREAFRVCREAGTWFAIENVVGALRAISAEFGPPRARHNPWFMWGNFPGFIAPLMRKNIGGPVWRPLPGDGKRGQRRSMIPYPLARAVAEACLS